MAALFFDLDGTCLSFHKNEWLPGVREKLIAFSAKGHQIYFITMTGPQDASASYNESARRELLENTLPFPFILLTNVHSPRVMIDDGETHAVKVDTNDATWVNRLEGL